MIWYSVEVTLKLIVSHSFQNLSWYKIINTINLSIELINIESIKLVSDIAKSYNVILCEDCSE